MGLLVALLATAATTCTVPPNEQAEQMALPYAAFDARGGDYGWRKLNGSGCADAAVSLLAEYASTHAQQLTGEQQREIAFHSGQVLAMAGRDKEAIARFEQAHGAGEPPDWRAYVDATLAFLRHDTAALATARERYAAVAPGSMRLRFIDGFIACPNEPYSRAVHCKR